MMMQKLLIPVAFLFTLTGTVIGAPSTLEADTSSLYSGTGGTINFTLDAGIANANRDFAIFVTGSGTSPGTPLPGGSVVLPINWDCITNFMLIHFPGLVGTLDNNGKSQASLTLPGNLPITQNTPLNFAFALAGPWNVVSNPVEVTLITDMSLKSMGDLLGWEHGGDICWLHGYNAGPGDYIDMVSTVFGSLTYPGYSPPNGTPVKIYVWDDPTNDFDPSDAVLLQSISGYVQNADTGLFNDFKLPKVQAVTGVFYVGCSLFHMAGQYPAPLNTNGPPPPYADAWIAGAEGGVFDPTPPGPALFNLAKIGLPVNFKLQASL